MWSSVIPSTVSIDQTLLSQILSCDTVPLKFPFLFLLVTAIRPSEDQLKEAAQTLSVTDVVSFLKKFKLDQYQELFEDEQVNGKLLQILSADDLEEMGVTKGYHRRKIVAKFEEYLQELVKTL